MDDIQSLETTLVATKGRLTIGTSVFHILQAVHTEGNTEAGPEHGEAENTGDCPCHHTWLAGGGRVHCCLKQKCLIQVSLIYINIPGRKSRQS